MQRRASAEGVVMVACQKISLGRVHASKTVVIAVTQTHLEVDCDDQVRTFRRTNTNAVTHTKVNQARNQSVGRAPADASTVYLPAVLPHSKVLRLPGLNYDSAQTYGKPEMIAAALRLFFGQ